MKKRFLTNYTIFNSVIYRHHIWSFDNGLVSSEPFDIETPNTVFLDGILVIGNHELVEPKHIMAIKSILSSDSASVIEAVCAYIEAHNLNVCRKYDVRAIELKNMTKEVLILEI